MIKIKDIKYVTYGTRDLDAMEAFMTDYGLVTTRKTDSKLYMRGTSSAPYVYVAELSDKLGLISVAMETKDEADFIKAGSIAGASAVVALDGPGGGRRVTFQVPGGVVIDVVHGIEPVAETPLAPNVPLNFGPGRQRINETQRPVLAPPQVMRLGHVALGLSDATATKNWMVANLGIIVSDTLLVPGTQDHLGYFVRCDQGLEPADHHTFLLANLPEVGAHHASFELKDLDALQMGCEWMKHKGYLHQWGVGRHELGSQIFDYWWDPDGNRIEHYTDGDVFDATVPSGEPIEATNEHLQIWGPDVPETFFNLHNRKVA